MKDAGKLLVLLAIGLLLAMIVVGCQPQEEQVVIGFSQASMTNPWRVAMTEEIKMVGKEYDARIVVLDAGDDAAKQVADLEDLVAQKVDAIIVTTLWSDGITPGIETANKAGIPVIVLSADLEEGVEYDSYIATENAVMGKLAGEWLVEQLDGKGKYVELIGSPGSHAVEERSRGFHEVVDQYEGLEMIAQVSGNFHYSESMSAIEDVLAANPGPIDALYTHFDDMALGALEAIKNDGRVGEIMIVSANAGSKAFLEEVREGNAHAGVVYPTLGRKGVETALKLINGEKVEKRISVPTFVFDQSNVDRYYNPDMVDYFLIEQK